MKLTSNFNNTMPVILLFIILLLGNSSLATEATEWSSPSFGGGGGKNYNLDCGNNRVLIGIQGKSSDWVDSISAICRKVNHDGTLGEPFTIGPTGGSGGSVRRSKPCPNGYVIDSLHATSTFDFVRHVFHTCAMWDARTKSVRIPSLPDGYGKRHGIWPNGKALSEISANFRDDLIHCPPGMPGKALRGKSGTYVDSISLVCDNVSSKAKKETGPKRRRR